jgi:hypothetical protein
VRPFPPFRRRKWKEFTESGHHGFPYPASYLVKKTGKFKNAVKQYAAGSYASHRQLFKNRFAAEIHMNIATK